MSKKMLINATLPEEDRVAIVEDGTLTELDIEFAGRQQTKSNIYKAEVVRVEQGLQAAFVDYGAQRPGFLQIGEIHPSLYPKRDDDSPHPKRPAITDILKRGQQILVQVVKEERGNKGAALTTEISLPGRYMVLMPESNSRGISRKIDNDQVRKGIKQAMAGLDLPDNMGYIIRTAAIDQPPEELKRDFDYLLNTYNSIVAHNETAKAPALIYQESNLVIRSIRDYFSPEIDEVLIDDREVFQKARDFFKAVMPEYAHLVKLHQERRPIFARYQIEEQISQLSSNTVNLPSGGSIVLDQTEALVAIDVNSGKMASEQDVEATAHRVNLEAAVEVARQLRLRDMGGLIVIDFIDMRQRKNTREVEKALKSALKIDKARVTVGRISHQFGLLEMSRQRIKANLGEGTYHICSHCQGNGRIRSEESRSVALLRRIQAGTAKGNVQTVACTTALDTANYLLNNKRRELYDLEQRYKLTIQINGDALYLPEQVEIDFVKQSRENSETRQTQDQTPLVDIDLSERANADVSAISEPATDGNAEQNGAQTNQQPANEEREGNKRPRRRRRSGRRRGERSQNSEAATADTTTTAAEGDDTTPQAETESSTEQTTPQTDDSQSASTATDTPTERPVSEEKPAAEEPTAEQKEEPVKKRPSRRRRPARKSSDQPTATAETQPATSVNEGSLDNAAAASSEPPTDSLEVTAEKPKRSTPRRKTAASKETAAQQSAAEAVETATPSAEQAVTPAEATSTTEQESAEQKKPTRRRRTTKKASESTTEEQANNTTADSDEAVVAEKPKRRAPRRKPAASKTPAAPETAAETATPQTDQANTEEAASETKPTRRRRTTKKVSEAKAITETTADSAVKSDEPKSDSSVADTASDDNAVEEKPKRRAPRRKTAASKEAAPKADSDKTTTTDEPAAEKKPVRRRRTTAKKSSDETAASSEQATATDSDESVTEKPKRRAPRRKATPVKDAETQPATETTSTVASDEAETEKKKPVRRRRTTTKKAATKGDGTEPTASDSDATAEKPKPKRRAPQRKKATEEVPPEPSQD